MRVMMMRMVWMRRRRRRRRGGDDFELDAYKDWLMAEGSETGNTYVLSLVH